MRFDVRKWLVGSKKKPLLAVVIVVTVVVMLFRCMKSTSTSPKFSLKNISKNSPTLRRMCTGWFCPYLAALV